MDLYYEAYKLPEPLSKRIQHLISLTFDMSTVEITLDSKMLALAQKFHQIFPAN